MFRKKSWFVKLLVLLVSLLFICSTTGCRRGGRSGEEKKPAPVATKEEKSVKNVTGEENGEEEEEDTDVVIDEDHSSASSDETEDTAEEVSKGGREYIVKKGDSLWKIANQFSVKVEALKQFNRIDDRAIIKPGQKLYIPTPEENASVKKAKPVSQPSSSKSEKKKIIKEEDSEEELSDTTGSVPVAPKRQASYGWPVSSNKVLRPYTPARKGIDIKATEGEAVRAVADGEVVFADVMKGYGKIAIVDHLDGTFTIYGHQKELTVKKGDTVRAGDRVGTAGEKDSEGNTFVYFEMRRTSPGSREPEAVDPMKYISKI